MDWKQKNELIEDNGVLYTKDEKGSKGAPFEGRTSDGVHYDKEGKMIKNSKNKEGKFCDENGKIATDGKVIGDYAYQDGDIIKNSTDVNGNMRDGEGKIATDGKVIGEYAYQDGKVVTSKVVDGYIRDNSGKKLNDNDIITAVNSSIAGLKPGDTSMNYEQLVKNACGGNIEGLDSWITAHKGEFNPLPQAGDSTPKGNIIVIK